MTLCIILALVAGCPRALADEATSIPPAVPPHPIVEQPAVQGSPLRELQHEKLAERVNRQFIIRVHLMEVNLKALAGLGIDFESNDSLMKHARMQRAYTPPLDGDGDVATTLPTEATFKAASAEGQSELRSFLDMLERNGVARTIADPVLVTVSGRPASFRTGGELRTPAAESPTGAIAYQRLGTELRVLIETLHDNTVRLDLQLCVREIGADFTMIVEGTRIPSVQALEIDTSVEATIGKTVQYSGLVTKRTTALQSSAGTKYETIRAGQWLFVTVESADPGEHAGATSRQGVAPCPPVDDSAFREAPASAP